MCYVYHLLLRWLPLFDASFESVMCTKFAILSIRLKSVCVHVSYSTFLFTAPTMLVYLCCIVTMELWKLFSFKFICTSAVA